MMDFVLLAAGEASPQDLSIFHPASPSAESIRSLSLLVFAITGFIFVVVEGVLIYCLWRFWQRKSAHQSEPPQIYGSKPIEVAWTAAPAVIVFILSLVTTRTLWEVRRPPPQPAVGDNTLFVTVVGRQWWWEYAYDYYNGQKLTCITANELHIPVSDNGIARPVHLTLKSADVCHSFWVPRLGGKTDLIPGHPNDMWFETRQPGLYVGQCAEFCGAQHANMLLRVVAESPADFERWLAGEERPSVADPAVSQGRAAFLAQSCVNCHRVRGTIARGTYAPDLTHLMSRATLAAGILPNTPENLARWVRAPQEIKPGCLMPAFGLSEKDREAMIRYLLTLH
jgi:cytochrome c oxidase subunit 2